MSQLSEQQLEKQKRSMDKFLYEKNVEDLIVEIRDFKRKPECKETFLKDLDKVIKLYKTYGCISRTGVALTNLNIYAE